MSAGDFTQGSGGYFDNSGRSDVLSGGVRMIRVQTPKGTFRVWTKRVGNNPATKLLLLHGGPGATHEGFEAFDSYLPGAGVEYYYYDQLGSAYSDQPDEPDLWEVVLNQVLFRYRDDAQTEAVLAGVQQAARIWLSGTTWDGRKAIRLSVSNWQTGDNEIELAAAEFAAAAAAAGRTHEAAGQDPAIST